MFEATTRRRANLTHRIADAIDLAVDFATLGQYGLEPLPAADGRCELDGHRAGWEAPAAPRRRGCSAPSRRAVVR